jgi:hypothetical protein
MTFFGADLPAPLTLAAYLGALTIAALIAFALWATVGSDLYDRMRGRLPAMPGLRRAGLLAKARHRLGQGGGA